MERRGIEAEVSEWLDFLSVYHDGIVGWVGGTKKIEGHDASPEAVELRKRLLREAAERVFGGERTFMAEWTYVDCVRAS